MPAFTTKFKVTTGIIGAIAVAGGLVANQVILTNKVNTLEAKPAVVKEVITATPSATLAPSVSPTPKFIRTVVTGILKK